MNDRDWSAVYDPHTRGAYKITQAAWPYMLKQRYGRIIYTSSYAGLYGLSNATSYSAGTMGVAGFMRALFREGQKYNIRANAIAIPVEPTLSSQVLSLSLAACLCSEKVPQDSTGGIYEVGSDWVSKTRWQRSGGHLFRTTKTLTPEDVVQEWNDIATFDDRSDYPSSPPESLAKMQVNVGVGKPYRPIQLDAKSTQPSGQISGSTVIEKINSARQTQWKGSTYTYTVRDLLLYSKWLPHTLMGRCAS
jgi:multifunctional beta-oxidation protein